MNVDRNIFLNSIMEVCPNEWVNRSYFIIILGTSFNKTDEDNVSILAPHQSYFDEYPSGTGRVWND